MAAQASERLYECQKFKSSGVYGVEAVDRERERGDNCVGIVKGYSKRCEKKV